VIAASNKAAKKRTARFPKGTGQTFWESRLRSGDGHSAGDEVAAIAREGTDTGLVYGSVDWGFIVSETGEVERQHPTVNGQGNASKTFHDAVAAWNDQAAYEASMAVGAAGKRVQVSGIHTENEDWTLPSRDASATDELSVRQRAFGKRAFEKQTKGGG